MLYYKTYTQAESKEWVVLVHGAGGSSTIWFKQLKDFIKHFNVLLVDLRGHGKSKDIFWNQEYSFKEVSKDVVDVLNHVGIQSAHFIGVSLGTIVIRNIAEVDNSKIKSMILGGAITRLNIRSQFLMRIADWLKRVLPFIWIYTIFAHILMPRRRHRESRSLFIREAKNLRQSEFLRWFTLTAEINPLLRYFNEKEIPVPTLYIMGDEDYMFLPQVKRLVKQHKFSKLFVVENCGHVCNVEQPEIFNELSIEFIKNHS
ncbi:alpha/beta fold hydrolase [Thermoflexibacter ruber]|uniref:Pimeloyl-ACP methyl ester carboxylesterase n=1 Tax=Thermoflexibacter ruber TaxID=1003 RepID=A0A1I2ICB7_9BACT|nr:alpha/beta hydrolase [Thermoflexibacter ruber]SFF39270.1 Pimeloyl-ACP methyl ester carboxylesterase [Thermoflexibacter ruber]